MYPAISQVCTLSASFEEDVVNYALAGCDQMEVWFTKLENHLKVHSLEQVRRLCDEHGVRLPSASYQGGLFVIDSDKWEVAWELFCKRLSHCRQLEIPTLILAADVPHPLSQSVLDGLHDRLTRIALEAGRHEVRIAWEFQSRSAFVTNLQTAASLVGDVGSPHLGICLDVFEFFLGPSRLEDLQAMDPRLLFHVQMSDLAGIPRELATDADRILPGDGDFGLHGLVDWLNSVKYADAVVLELMNPGIFEIPPRSFGQIGWAALKKCLDFKA